MDSDLGKSDLTAVAISKDNPIIQSSYFNCPKTLIQERKAALLKLPENMWSPLVNSYTFIMVLDAMPLQSASSVIHRAEPTFTRPICSLCPGLDPM